jgi:hypothetical protein
VPYPSLYRAKAVSIRSGAVEAFVPQVFGETTVTITDALGLLPTAPTMGWVFFQAGNPEFPVWSSGLGAAGGGGDNGNGGGPPVVVPDEVWVGPGTPPDAVTELWYDTDEPDVAPLDQSIKEQYFHFPASLSLAPSLFTGLSLTPVQGDTLMDVISLPRPVGWGGPDPLNVFAFRETGLYEVQGNLSLSTTVNGEQGLTYFQTITRAGAASLNARGAGAPYGPLLYNTYALFQRTVWVTSIDTALRFAVLVQPSGVTTWSSPGSLSIIKVRP